MDAGKLTTLCVKVTGLCGTRTEHNGIKLFKKLVCRIVAANLGVLDEGNAFALHQIDTALNNKLFVELHVGYAVHHQAAKTIVPLKHGDAVASLVELVSAGKTRRAGANNNHPFSGSVGYLF